MRANALRVEAESLAAPGARRFAGATPLSRAGVAILPVRAAGSHGALTRLRVVRSRTALGRKRGVAVAYRTRRTPYAPR